PYSAVNLHPGGNDVGYGVALDHSGNVYVTGSTSELGTLAPTTGVFPLQDALQGYVGPASATPQLWYHTDAFLAGFTSSGTLLYSTDLGGSFDDVGTGVAADSTGAYVTGYTRSGDFPLQSAEQPINIAACPTANQGCLNSEAFISKFSFNTPGVRVFIGAVVPSNTSLKPSVPITVTGLGCSPGSYTAGNPANATLGVPLIFQAGANCTVNVSNTSPLAGVRYGFASWADSPGGNPRLLNAPSHGFTYTVNLAPQYQLTTSVTGAGTLTINPPSSDGFYANGATVQLTATPAPGYAFLGFTGDLFAAISPQAFMMTQPYNVTATFVPSAVPSVSIDAPVNNSSISGSVTVTGWALDNTSEPGTAISQVQVFLDGALMGNATYGLDRPDICGLYPNRPGCPNVGYSFTLNANTLVPGTHLITVTATDTDGTPDSGSASVNVISFIAMTGAKAAVFRNNVSFLADSNGNGLYDANADRFIANFTAPGGFLAGDLPVVGDWTGDGQAKVGIYRPSSGTWWLDANNDGVFDSGDYTYQYGGLAGDLPVVGDWNGVAGVSTHKDCIGIYRTQGSFWLLDLNCNGTFDNTPADAFFPFGGLAGDVPVVGRWSGGLTQVGVVRKYAPGGVPVGNPFFWVPDAGAANAGNTPASHPADITRCFAFGGLTGDVFVTGDWNNTGTSLAGVYRNGFWVLDGAMPSAPQASHIPGFSFGYGGSPGDIPVPGKW
ncbi:MAG TPA: Ig-like domain-containing protein, partial [Bryobacteraceae bacterium]